MDTQFLGGDILDEEHQLRPGQGGVDPAVFNLADAVILGNIGDDSSSFETSDSGFHLKADLGAARIYVSGRSQAVMSPDAVIALIDRSEKVRLTPFEKHVLRFIDGKRPVEVIRRQAGLDEAEVKTALANLADKGVVKVVGRALADSGDFESETAPGNAPKGKPRRMRGTLVGAVVVVGDAADQAIDDAFRTNVRVDAPADLAPVGNDDDGVFTGSDADLPQADPADIASFGGGTDEVPMRRPPTSSTSTVRPASLRNAVNASGRTAARGGVPVPKPQRSAKHPEGGIIEGSIPVSHVMLSDVDLSDQSDGFDEFGVASNLATAVVQQPSLSESSLPGVEQKGGPVFVEPAPGRGRVFSDLEDFDAPGVGDLADSRVAPRPELPPLPPPPPRAAPPATPSLSNSNLDSVGGSLNQDERDAMSGGVWDDAASEDATNVRDAPAGPKSLRSSGSDEPTNVREAPAGISEVKDQSTSLSALLDSDESAGDESDDGDGFDEEPTGLRDPPPKVARPAVAPRPASPRMVSPVESGKRQAPPASSPRPAPVVAGAPRPPVTAPPAPPSLSGDGDAWEGETPRDSGRLPAAKPSPPPPRSPMAAAPPTPAAPPARAAGGAADDLYPDEEEDFSGVPTEQVKPKAQGSQDTAALSQGQVPLDVTMPPSVVADDPDASDVDDEDSAWSSSNSPHRRAQPQAPEPSRYESRAGESASRAVAPAPAPRVAPPVKSAQPAKSASPPAKAAPPPAKSAPPPAKGSEPLLSTSVSEIDRARQGAGASSSAEVLDSAMVIRPALKAAPLALQKKPKLAAAAADDVEEGEADDFMVDPDATANLPPMPKSEEGQARRRRAAEAPAAPPPPSPALAEPPQAKNGGSNRQPTEDMRRKARNLMEQAQKDHSDGRVGAARMNAKLATIYDPDNEAYRRILAEWDRPSGTGAESRPEYVDLYEKAQEREDDDDVDGALELLERGIRVAPNPAAFHNRIGVLLAMRKKDFERAKDEIQKAIALEPKNPHYHNNLGKVMAKANRRRGDAVVNAR